MFKVFDFWSDLRAKAKNKLVVSIIESLSVLQSCSVFKLEAAESDLVIEIEPQASARTISLNRSSAVTLD